MSLAELWRIVVRRRWLLVPAVVLSLLAGAAGYAMTPASYSQSQSYLLLSPVITDSGRGNPFLQLGNGVAMAASVLSKRVSGGEVAATITGSEPGLGYTVSLDPTTSAPVLVVAAEAPDPDAVTSALERIEDTLTEELAALQDAAGAPEISWVTISPLAGDVAPLMSRSEGLRTGLVGTAGVLVLALLVVAALELWRTRMRYRTAPVQPAAADDLAAPRPDGGRSGRRWSRSTGSAPGGRPRRRGRGQQLP
ncbi:hypothetical protein DQ239_09955 [Blastococcus sp. TF02-09]|uniref:hypothetical protein n=1 Tax=Blastococcus sp. TF02-09 TaxID=2250576 RepID=UPI000DE83FED|nr:hypothetical protein [Blastococcus sp. TF02-9]RBY78012.1 hypothetical protein DQ239_09955 [Blastococcus sp. TF02-9]